MPGQLRLVGPPPPLRPEALRVLDGTPGEGLLAALGEGCCPIDGETLTPAPRPENGGAGSCRHGLWTWTRKPKPDGERRDG